MICIKNIRTEKFRFFFASLKSESESHSVVSDSLRPHVLYSPWNSPGQNTGVGSLSLLQGIFPTQGSNPGLPHCRWILYQLSHQGNPKAQEIVDKSPRALFPSRTIPMYTSQRMPPGIDSGCPEVSFPRTRPLLDLFSSLALFPTSLLFVTP